MFDVKTFGTLASQITGPYEKTVSISYDTVEHDPNCDVKVVVQIEPPSTDPFNTSQLILDNYQQFDLVLTWRKELFHLPNVQKYIFGSCWIDWENFKPNKKNQVSFITSSKNWAPGHQIRLSIWDGLEEAENLNGFEILKYKSPPWVDSRNFLFEHAKYSIVVENQKLDNLITEKVIDCFATKTVPIYWGCPNIGDYFNSDGIITFDTLENLKDILDNLEESYYDSRIDIIEENFEKSKKYWDFQKTIETIIKEYIKQL